MPEKNLALRALKKALGAVVLADTPSLTKVSLDSSRIARMPEALVRPQNSSDIQAMLLLANRHGVPITTRGGGTASTGAATPICGGWVLDLSGLRKVHLDAVAGIVQAEVGITIAALKSKVERKGWFYPPDPSSMAHCTLGGTIATNAGGPRAAKYGVTRDYVLGLEGFLPTGEAVRWGAPLKKFSAGYNIRDLWVGSEGTLGVITRASLKLVPKPPASCTALIAFKNEAMALRAARALLKIPLMPSALEFMDRQTVRCAQLHSGRKFFKQKAEVALLLIELDGHPAELKTQAAALRGCLSPRALSFKMTQNPEQAEALWEARRTCSQAMFLWGNTKLNEDVVVPLKAAEALIAYTLELKTKTGLATPTFGHAADGNFHVHLMYDADVPKQCKAAQKALSALMQKVVALDGAISGEHGIGLAKTPFFHLQHGAAERKIMAELKRVFDPNNILNPGKIFEPFSLFEHPRARDHRFDWD